MWGCSLNVEPIGASAWFRNAISFFAIILISQRLGQRPVQIKLRTLLDCIWNSLMAATRSVIAVSAVRACRGKLDIFVLHFQIQAYAEGDYGGSGKSDRA